MEWKTWLIAEICGLSYEDAIIENTFIEDFLNAIDMKYNCKQITSTGDNESDVFSITSKSED